MVISRNGMMLTLERPWKVDLLSPCLGVLTKGDLMPMIPSMHALALLRQIPNPTSSSMGSLVMNVLNPFSGSSQRSAAR